MIEDICRESFLLFVMQCNAKFYPTVEDVEIVRLDRSNQMISNTRPYSKNQWKIYENQDSHLSFDFTKVFVRH